MGDILTEHYRHLEDQARRKEAEAKAAKAATYLPDTHFNGDRNYSVEIDGAGLIVYSECCADRMSDETARKVHEALGRYLDAKGTAAL